MKIKRGLGTESARLDTFKALAQNVQDQALLKAQAQNVQDQALLEILAKNVQDQSLLEALALVGGLKSTKCDKKRALKQLGTIGDKQLDLNLVRSELKP